jgi:hypothetical protein
VDVLEYWSPTIDWAKFQQGGISEEVWLCFKQVVQLCHAFRYWETDAQDKRLCPPRLYLDSVPAESRPQFRKREDHWKSEILQSENRRNRAKFLVSEKIAELSYLGTNSVAGEAEGTADWKLWYALQVAARPYPPAAAFGGFDAEKELDGEVNEIVARWLQQARYSV